MNAHRIATRLRPVEFVNGVSERATIRALERIDSSKGLDVQTLFSRFAVTIAGFDCEIAQLVQSDA